EIASELEDAVGSQPTEAKLRAAVKKILKRLYAQHQRVIFNGDNYSDAWREEAQKRGLPHLRRTPEALNVLTRPEAFDLFDRYKVLTKRELQSRYQILLDTYLTQRAIEAETMVYIARTMVLPAAVRYQTEVAEAV